MSTPTVQDLAVGVLPKPKAPRKTASTAKKVSKKSVASSSTIGTIAVEMSPVSTTPQEMESVSKTTGSKYRSPYIKIYEECYIHQDRFAEPLLDIQSIPLRHHDKGYLLLDNAGKVEYFEVTIHFAKDNAVSTIVARDDIEKVTKKIRNESRKFCAAVAQMVGGVTEERTVGDDDILEHERGPMKKRKVSKSVAAAPVETTEEEIQRHIADMEKGNMDEAVEDSDASVVSDGEDM